MGRKKSGSGLVPVALVTSEQIKAAVVNDRKRYGRLAEAIDLVPEIAGTLAASACGRNSVGDVLDRAERAYSEMGVTVSCRD